MQLFLNLLVITAIITGAIVIIVRNFRKVRTAGKCAACDYDCTVKKLKQEHDHALLKH